MTRLSFVLLAGSSSSVSWLHNDLQVAMVGHKVDLSFTYDHLGEETSVLKELANGTHPFCKVTNTCSLARRTIFGLVSEDSIQLFLPPTPCVSRCFQLLSIR